MKEVFLRVKELFRNCEKRNELPNFDEIYELCKKCSIDSYNAAKEECTGIVTKRMGELADRIGWHYPSKGELPPSGQDVLIHNRKKYLIDRYYSDGDEWLYTKNEDVVAWYYLPELVKP